MKVLFVTCRTDDWLASCLWDGLRDVVGDENLWLANDNPGLTVPSESTNHRIVGAGRPFMAKKPWPHRFDLMVLNAAMLRDHKWDFAFECREQIAYNGKIVYVEGWDGATEVNTPPFHVDAVFRREILPGYVYPYQCQQLFFGIPERWFEDGEHERPYDVLSACLAKDIELRWQVASQVFRTERRTRSVVTTDNLAFDHYLHYLRHSKLAVCPPGAGSDCMRQWEAIAAGAIPLFVAHPSRPRGEDWPWGLTFWAEKVEDLPRLIDHALGSDLVTMRRELQAFARRHHTTRQRALKVLGSVGLA